MLDLLWDLEYYSAHHSWARRKNFQNKVFRRLEIAILIFVVANTANYSFNYKFFQLLYKHYPAFYSSKLPVFDNLMIQLYLNFLKFKKVAGLPGIVLLNIGETRCKMKLGSSFIFMLRMKNWNL